MDMIEYVKENIEMNFYTENAIKKAKRKGVSFEEIIKRSSNVDFLERFNGIGPATLKNIRGQIIQLKLDYIKREHNIG